MYRVEWEFGNCSGNMCFETIEDANEFADEIGGETTITEENKNETY